MTHLLSLGEASRLLGVSPSTLRNWSDQGMIQALRTPGGHRRFHHTDVQALQNRLRERRQPFSQPKTAPPGPQAVQERIRQVVQSELQPAHEPIQGEARDQQREDGRELLSLAVQYAARQDEATSILLQARDNGRRTGQRLAAQHYTLTEMLQAYFTYAHRIEQLILPEFASNQGLNPEEHRVEQRLRHFFAQVLLAMADAFDCSTRSAL